MRNFFILLISILFSATVHAKECTQSILDEADRNAGNFGSWENVYSYSKKYSGCIGDDTQESVSEGIVRMLADKWDQLHDLKKLVEKDKKFENFVIYGIDSTVSGDDLLKIHSLAKKQCPKDSKKLCKTLSREALRAYKEMDDF